MSQKENPQTQLTALMQTKWLYMQANFGSWLLIKTLRPSNEAYINWYTKYKIHTLC